MPRKVLFLAASGIGNTILATPLIQKARELWPEAELDLLTSRRVFQAPLRRSSLIQNYFDLELRAAMTLLRLRQRRYDVSITCFPSNRWQFNVVAGVVGAKYRLGHHYAEGNRFAWLMNSLVAADESLHDIEQNLCLLSTFTAETTQPAKPLLFALQSEDEHRAEEWLQKKGLATQPLMGVHVGSVDAPANSVLMNRPIGAIKAPPAEQLRSDIAGQPSDRAILFVGGPEEEETIRAFIQTLSQEVQQRCHRFSGDLWTTAALMQRCMYFVSGDTALMHIAAVFNIPQKAYFVTTNPSRTAPRNNQATIVVGDHCASYGYPFKLS